MFNRNIYSAAGERMRNLNIPDGKKASSENNSEIEISKEDNKINKDAGKKAETHYSIYSSVAHRMRYIQTSSEEKKDPPPQTVNAHNKDNIEKIKLDKSEDEKERVKTNIDTLVTVANKMRNIDTSSHETIDFKKLFSKFKKRNT